MKFENYSGTAVDYIAEYLDPDGTLGESMTTEEEARELWASMEENYKADGGTGIDEELFLKAVAEIKFVAMCQLANDGGVSGPQEMITTTIETATDDAIAWADGEIGHPWDTILVTVYSASDEGLRNPLETYQIEHHDNAWEIV